jgi:hypothetical protein
MPEFTVYGFWIKDPLINGIGQDTYKTSAECVSTYFLPLSTSDSYNGKLLQVAEPPPVISEAAINIPQPAQDDTNLESIGATAMTRSTTQPTAKKKNPQVNLPYQLLLDPNCKSAFNNTKQGEPILVKRNDTDNSDYYLVPFNKFEKNRTRLTSAVAILDSRNGYFKEASWTKVPERFLRVSNINAINLINVYLLNDLNKRLNKLPKKPLGNYVKERNALIMNYRKLLLYVRKAKMELQWSQHSAYSSSPYQPYYKVNANGYIWYVTQDGKVYPQIGLNKMVEEIDSNRKILEKIR